MAFAKKEKSTHNGYSIPDMTPKEFELFRVFIYNELGIHITPAKQTLLQARLQKRVKQLGFTSYKEYGQHLLSPEGRDTEYCKLVDAITTNTTEFFREPRHFEYLQQTFLPAWTHHNSSKRPLSLWSAGCSSGEEPYTLSMVLSYYRDTRDPQFSYSLLATDVCSDVLQTATKAIYSMQKAEKIPMQYKKRYLLRSKDRKKSIVRVAPEIRKSVNFRRLNFKENFQFRERMDIIFCRNVLIYFDRETQESLLRKFCNHLVSGGLLFIGHSESLSGMQLPVKQAYPTIYSRT